MVVGLKVWDLSVHSPPPNLHGGVESDDMGRRGNRRNEGRREERGGRRGEGGEGREERRKGGGGEEEGGEGRKVTIECYTCKSVTKFHVKFDTQTELL